MSQDKLSQNKTQDEIITPIDFTPHDSSADKFSFRPSPVKVAISFVLVCFALTAWFVLSAKSIFIDAQPLGSIVEVKSPLAIKIGPRYLVLAGGHEIYVNAPGYYDVDTTITVGDAQAQTFQILLLPLPGYLNLDSNVEAASVFIDGEELGLTPLSNIELAAGEHEVLVRKDRYEAIQQLVGIEGREQEQNLTVELLEAWANVSFSTFPAGAAVTINGKEVGLTPLSAEILEGEHEVLIKLNAHKAWTESLSVTARIDQNLPSIELEEADGLVLLQSSPSNAGVTLDGAYQGQTPLELTIAPGESHELTFFLNGYEELQRNIQTQADQELALDVSLDPILSSVAIIANPPDAELFINGESQGTANQTIELLAASQLIEIRAEGFVPFTQEFVSRPGLEQQLNVSLVTLEQERINNIQPMITSSSGQELKLLYPGNFVMGASRREAGRQANESLRSISLTKAYYLSLTEVTNAQFKQFDPEHSSGVIDRISLSNNNQPVVEITWEQAAMYCNWLSQQEGLPPFYTIQNSRVAGSDPNSSGYRLPTEAEWAWAARVESEDPTSLLKFPWGAELPPPPNHGNYADLSAASILGRILVNYNDSFVGSSPIASFPPNANGFYDLGGNVSEWVHDYYGTAIQLGNNIVTDPYGPETGTYHVVRGSSWAHGSVTELRLSYRDYSNETRDDVGFRVARTLVP
ncbi:MAG: PEGA domain-containing protein [Gammaproteobacteria bacterium]|jgi:formylglycine-generating enzyme required for sulfatase activity|nr:PEGA domain-containing protein [Gammaproteobacteria bacterium]